MIRVLVADDHPVVRKGLIFILADAADIEVEFAASSAQEVVQALSARHHAIDVVVLDVSIPGRSGLELLKDLRRDHPQLPVLMLSQLPEEQIGVHALRAGAAGYLSKESAPEQLAEAVRHVHLGLKFVTPIVPIC